jgi:hypothetical protein
MTRKTAIQLILAAAVMPRIKAEEQIKTTTLSVLSNDSFTLTQPKDYTLSFAPTLERLHIEIGGKRFTLTPSDIAKALETP